MADATTMDDVPALRDATTMGHDITGDATIGGDDDDVTGGATMLGDATIGDATMGDATMGDATTGPIPLFVELVVKNPLCPPRQPVQSDLFRSRLDAFIRGLPYFNPRPT
ncbi:hypothetical protein Q9233_017571 [Columba guinea]|nr:hypothetical protein Q9233_017571 [Columba guinea]